MKTVIQKMVEEYNPQNVYEKKNAIKEVMQEIILYGLSRAGFFKEAAFYGGTALRIFYGLDRFSEDLDFSLIMTNEKFSLDDYFSCLKKEVQSFGLNIDIKMKTKNIESSIKSAFMKGDTIEHFLLFYPDEKIMGINREEKIKIKLEIDVNPPEYATYERRFQLLPSPYEIVLYDESSLFAGKIHAILCRTWMSRVKGRDLYDYVFYLSRKTPVNLKHLKARLVQTNFINVENDLSINQVKGFLIDKFKGIDFDEAKKDVESFVNDDSKLKLWSKDFMIHITEQLIG